MTAGFFRVNRQDEQQSCHPEERSSRASALPSNAYRHAAVGDVDAVAQALELIADRAERYKGTSVAA